MKGFFEDFILDIAIKVEEVYASTKEIFSFELPEVKPSKRKSLLITNNNPELTKPQRILVDNISFRGMLFPVNKTLNTKQNKHKNDFESKDLNSIFVLLDYAGDLGLDSNCFYTEGYVSKKKGGGE